MTKRNVDEGALAPLTPGSLGRSLSASSDSGLSVASQGQRRGPPQDGHLQTGKPLPGLDFEIASPLLEVMTELAARGRGDAVGAGSGLGANVNGAPPSPERETDILDDEREKAPASEGPGSGSSLFRNLTETQTDSWVGGGGGAREGKLPPPAAPARGVSSRDAVKRGGEKDPANPPASDPEDLTSLTADVDESIEQLNRLILDLDPTFVPPTPHCSTLSRSASLNTNGISHKGKTQKSGEGPSRPWERRRRSVNKADKICGVP